MYREYYGQGHLHSVRRQDHELTMKTHLKTIPVEMVSFLLGAIWGDGDDSYIALYPRLGRFNLFTRRISYLENNCHEVLKGFASCYESISAIADSLLRNVVIW